jgi:hypothetical protein
MKWEKLGLVFCVDKNSDWMHSHAALPTPVRLNDDVFRVYFSTRDRENRSHGAFVDVDLKTLSIVNLASEPVLSPGSLGLFDDSGVTLSCFLPDNQVFYYMGWNLPKNVPFSNQIGAAKFVDSRKTKLEKLSIMPHLGKCSVEPMSFGYPWVTRAQGKFYMWYDTNLNWKNNSTSDYQFTLRMAESMDGLVWKKAYLDCFPLDEHERAHARPCVIHERNVFKMWYSINKNGKYRLGYAESRDARVWERKDSEIGIDVSMTGWDCDEIEYAYVFDHKQHRYMLYNGNSYGKTGFGLAKLVPFADE